MSRVRIVLILTENWTMRPTPDVADLVMFAWAGSPVSHDGKHYSFGPVWVEPPPARSGGPDLWFGGSSLHPRLIARLVRYGSGFNPLGPAGDLAPLEAAMTAAGRRPGELEYVGGTRGVFAGADTVADLDQALAVVPARLEVKVVLAALARRVSRFELAGEPRRIRSNFTNGLKALPVRVTP